MTWLDFIVLTLAASAVIDCWFNGSLFADWRAFFETLADEPTEAQSPNQSPPGSLGYHELPPLMTMADRVLPRWVAELLLCPFCFSYHAPWIVGVVLFFPACLVETQWVAFLLKLPAYSLAATRLGNLINAFAPEEAKYRP